MSELHKFLFILPVTVAWFFCDDNAKLIPELSKKLYSDRLRLRALKLPTLKYRRYRGDMIELFKIIKGIYDPACVPHFEYMELTDNLIRTRGNKFKLVQLHCHYDLRKYNFTNRVIPIWNSLSNHVVSAETVWGGGGRHSQARPLA